MTSPMWDEGELLATTSAALSRYTTTIGEQFPALHFVADEYIGEARVETRAYNALMRHRCETWGALCEITPGELLAWRNVGERSLRSIVAAAATRDRELQREGVQAAPATPTAAGESSLDQSPDAHSGRTPGDRLPALAAALLSHRTFLVWAATQFGAKTVGDALAPAFDSEMPEEVERALRGLLDIPIDALTIESELDPSSAAIDFLEGFGDDADVFAARTLALENRPTLEELGQARGVTRERIRQIEVRAREHAIRALADPVHSILRWRAHSVTRIIGCCVLQGSPRLESARATLTRGILDPPGTTAFELILWLGGGYQLKDGALIANGTTLAELATAVNEQLGDALTVSSSAVAEAAEAVGIAFDTVDELAPLIPDWRQIGSDDWVRWDGTVSDRAERVLTLLCTASTAAQINAHIGGGHVDGYIANVLTQDDRFIRVGKGARYALRDWGGDEYLGIAEEMRERILRSNGPVPLAHLIDELVNQFGVSELSVRTYASSAPMFVLEGDTVRLRRRDEPVHFDRTVARVSGLYVAPNGDVIVHIPVDHDVLRGSGRPFAPAAAALLGVLPDQQREFTSPTRPQSVSVWWRVTATSGPAIGSVRTIAEDLGAVKGDVLRLVFVANSNVYRAELRGLGTLSDMVGFACEPDPTNALAHSLECDVADVHAMLSARGDGDVAAAISQT